jgi:hypothetical protein
MHGTAAALVRGIDVSALFKRILHTREIARGSSRNEPLAVPARTSVCLVCSCLFFFVPTAVARAAAAAAAPHPKAWHAGPDACAARALTEKKEMKKRKKNKEKEKEKERKSMRKRQKRGERRQRMRTSSGRERLRFHHPRCSSLFCVVTVVFTFFSPEDKTQAKLKLLRLPNGKIWLIVDLLFFIFYFFKKMRVMGTYGNTFLAHVFFWGEKKRDWLQDVFSFFLPFSLKCFLPSLVPTIAVLS